MAYQISYEDAAGNTYEDSYWRIVQMNVDLITKRCEYVFFGFKNKTARDNNKQKIGMTSFEILGDEFIENY